MIAYRTTVANRKKFLYVVLTPEQAEEANLTSRQWHVNEGHTVVDKEIHLTTDGSFEAYCGKRLCIPQVVCIMDDVSEIEAIVNRIGFVL